MILMPIEAVFSIIMNAGSRYCEYQADRFACLLQDMLKNEEMSDLGDRLGRALIQLHVKNLSTVWVDWLCVFSRLICCCAAPEELIVTRADILPTIIRIQL